ncbi:MAG: hypothetical protein ACKOVA_13890, partial [Novosphingobium sp.]
SRSVVHRSNMNVSKAGCQHPLAHYGRILDSAAKYAHKCRWRALGSERTKRAEANTEMRFSTCCHFLHPAPRNDLGSAALRDIGQRNGPERQCRLERRAQTDKKLFS